jgi:hypothetical protein
MGAGQHQTDGWVTIAAAGDSPLLAALIRTVSSPPLLPVLGSWANSTVPPTLPCMQVSYVRRHCAQRPNKSESQLAHSRCALPGPASSHCQGLLTTNQDVMVWFVQLTSWERGWIVRSRPLQVQDMASAGMWAACCGSDMT